MVWGTQTNGLSPHLAVYDAYGQQVNADVLVNENGTYTVQVANAVPGAAYYVKVDAAGAAAGHTTGNYFLAIQFGPNAQNLQALGSGTLGATVPETSGTLAVGTTMLFHFVLSANASNAPSGTGVRLTILDSNGQVVGSLLAGVAQPVSLTMLLSAGTYRFIYDAVGPSGQPLPSVTYTLAGVGVSDPIGPQPVDPTMDPQSTTAPSDGTTSDSSTSTDTTKPPPDSTSTTDKPADSTTTTSTDTTTTYDSTSSSTDTTSDPTWTYQDDSGVQKADPTSQPATTA